MNGCLKTCNREPSAKKRSSAREPHALRTQAKLGKQEADRSIRISLLVFPSGFEARIR